MATTLSAQQLTQLEEGAVYRFVNRGTGRALNAGETSDGAFYVNATTVSTTDIKQQWYVTKDGDHYVLRNLNYAKYLKGATVNKDPWSLTDYATDTKNKFNLATSDASWNTLETNGTNENGYLYMHDDGNSYNGGYRVVSWVNEGANNSHWTVTKVEYSADELQTILDEYPTAAEIVAKRTANFVSLFNEGACYTPKYSTLTEAQATTEYQALETELQTLATNIYNKALNTDGWAEANANTEKEGWGAEYAKKFRVQMYEPYSIAGDITGFLRMNAHANNDNPTGIYVAEAGTVYVMVEGTIKDGATLRLVRAGSNGRVTNATGDGYALTTGLNVVNITEVTEGGDHLYICYNVDTYNPDGETVEEQFPHKLSEYPPLKIHIEGGYINGFYSSCGDYLAGKTYEGVTYNEDLWGGVDDDADWEYMEVRANLSVLPIVSHRQVLLFQLNEENGQKGMSYFLPENVSVPDTPFSYPQNGETSSWDDYDAYGMDCNTSTGRINIWMECWDRIMHAELATLGLISEADVNIMNKFYPRWTSDGEMAEIYDMTNAGPDGNTYKVFCRGLDYSEYYNHHGVSLGTTSDYMAAGWNCAYYNNTTFAELMGMPTSGNTWGPVHEIGHQFQNVFNIRGATEVTNNVFSNAATWYLGISTSRYNWGMGNLTTTLDNFNSGLPFVDYNIWSMTQMFYKLWLYYHLAGNNTQFYPRFFEMLRLDPLNAMGATATGTESMLKIYEKMCDAAGEDLTEFFRAHGFFVLLDHYAKGDYGTTIFTQTQEEVDAAIARVKAKYTNENFAVILINDGAEATLRHDGVTPRTFYDGTPNPEYGGVNDFINGANTTGGTYTATVKSDGTMTMTGEGGIGFLIFDETGKLISFADNSAFALNDEVMEAIMTGNATIVSVGTDINEEPVTATVDLSAMQKTILGTLIAKVQPIVDKIDDTYTKIGYYKAAAVADLSAALENAKTVYASSSGYEAAYDLLYAEYQKVLANSDARIPFDPSLTYTLQNYSYPTRNMVVSGTTVYANTDVDLSSNEAKWQFVSTDTPGVYYVKNMSGVYCPAISTSTSMTVTEEPADTDTYVLEDLGDGLWAISLTPTASNTSFHSAANDSYKIVGWGAGSDASKWYLTAVTANATIADLTNLEVYITKTETLLNEVLGEVTYTRGENIALQTTTASDPYYIWSNAPCTTEGEIVNLVDGATNNYFHTEWNGDAVTSGAHYIAVDLGADNVLPRFAFSHTTRSGVDSDFPKSVDVYGSDDNDTYKYIGSVTGMPQTGGTAWQFDGIMASSHRYLRFNYHANRGYWHLAEFDIMPVSDFTPTVNSTYSGTVTVEKVKEAMEALYNGKSVVSSISPDTETITTKYNELKGAYDALYAEYSATITARKTTLATLAANTQKLIDEVGTVQLRQETPVELTTTNFYCNAPYIASQNADYSAEYVSKLTDNDNSTFLHTRWNADSDDTDDHYLRVDMGEGVSISKFQFTYITASRVKEDMPGTMIVEGANEIDGVDTTKDTFTEIVTLTSLPSTLEENNIYISSVLGSDETPYRYLRFRVTDTGNKNDWNSNHPFFTMSEFGLSSVVEEEIAVFDVYKSNISDNLLLTSVHTTNSSTAMSTNELVTSVPLLDAQIADQQAAYDKLYAAKNNTAALKENLKKLIDDTQALYDEMATSEGAVNDYYSTSTLTVDNLSEASTEITDATTVYNNSSATVDEINAAYDELNAKYTVLTGIKDLDYTGERTIGTEITTAETLLDEVRNATEIPETVVLQNDDAAAPYYIWCNKPASDSNGIAGGLIDKNDDGTANTGTFFGTYWQAGVVDPYTHYLEIDLGCVKSIENFVFDYTTRASGYENQRPNGIKVLVSNDKEKYNEVLAVTEGLATDANAKWVLDKPFGFVGRYVRFAVSSQQGYFNMSDFNIDFDAAYSLQDFYTTSEIDVNLLTSLSAAVQQAVKARDCFVTADNYKTALDNLTAAYNSLNTFKSAHVSDRSELETLAGTTETLVTEVAAIDETETAITMQCTDATEPYYLYCNAEGKENGGTDALGVAALVGEKATNTEHLHTAYKGSTDDDLDHYLRLDMGESEAMMSFKFSYTGRNDGNNNDPKEMLIEGSNDLVNFEPIATLTDLPSSATPTTYTSDVLSNGKAYRYIRFMVTATNNNAKYNEHPFFVLSQFAVTACKTIEVNSVYQSVNLPLSKLVTANNEVVDAETMVAETEHYLTETAYNVAIEELQAAYDALDVATKTDKTALEKLIEATTLLKNDLYEMAVTSYNTEEVTLSATEGDAGWLYCNAEGSTNNYDGDNAGVAALLDNDTDTSNFLHTTYYGEDNDDGLDHYLRVDLGENGATDYIQFRYTGRSGYPDLTPSTAVIEATNDLAGEWTEITTLTGLEATTNEVSTGCLGNGNTYRYWRFMVTATHDGRVCDGHPYFALSAFNVDKCTDVVIESQLKYTPTIYIYTTSELVTEVEGAITAATAVKDNADATQTVVDAEVEALQAVYDKLEEALKYAGVPITITTDENNPVLYKIISKRDDNGGKVLQFDEPASDKVTIVDVADNASYQAWYFMEGTNGYLIKPFNGDGKMLGVSSTGDAQASATIAETATYAEWNFARSTVSGCTDYFYIYVNGTSHACLSHNGGFDATDKMGIWANGWNTNDGGTLFKFVDAEFENDNARFYQLSDFENTLEYQTSVTPEGTTVGAFTNGDAYSTAYSTAATLIEAGNTSDATACKDAYTALRAANDALVHHLPEAGKIYKIYITPGLTDDRAGASMRIDDDGKLACGVYDIANARFYFTFEYDAEGNLYMKNLHSATYVDEAPASGNNTQVGADAEAVADAKAITISTLGKSGETVVVGITPTSGGMLNCAAKEGNVVAFDNTAVDKASAWVIEEVEITTVEENVVHSVSLANNTQGDETTKRYSTLCLGYPVTLPADRDVQAYIATDVDDNNVIVLTPVGEDGKTIPANTPVILKSDTGVSSVTASFSADEAATVAEGTNLLGGTTYTTYVCCLDESGTNNVSNVYMLTRKNGIIAMRWMYENYLRNDDGTYSKHQNASSDEGGYVQCPANKAYLKLTSAVQSLSTEYYFGFFGGTTDIDKVNTEENPLQGTIYDLQGRKIEEVTVPGFYIVNGKKMFVNSELLK